MNRRVVTREKSRKVDNRYFHYVSQRAEQTSFLPQKKVDRRVVAVNFNRNRRFGLADYGRKHGKLCDFVRCTRPLLRGETGSGTTILVLTLSRA
jgi:outer membrane protein assembly factor BamE (lipoprotein component of BamABCDE complex)